MWGLLCEGFFMFCVALFFFGFLVCVWVCVCVCVCVCVWVCVCVCVRARVFCYNLVHANLFLLIWRLAAHHFIHSVSGFTLVTVLAFLRPNGAVPAGQPVFDSTGNLTAATLQPRHSHAVARLYAGTVYTAVLTTPRTSCQTRVSCILQTIRTVLISFQICFSQNFSYNRRALRFMVFSKSFIRHFL